MTPSQQRYWELQEQKRHNQATEEIQKETNKLKHDSNVISKYGIDTQAATSKYTADQHTFASKYSADTNAQIAKENRSQQADFKAIDTQLKQVDQQISQFRALTERAMTTQNITESQARISKMRRDMEIASKELGLAMREQDNKDVLAEVKARKDTIDTLLNIFDNVDQAIRTDDQRKRTKLQYFESLYDKTIGRLDDYIDDAKSIFPKLTGKTGTTR